MIFFLFLISQLILIISSSHSSISFHNHKSPYKLHNNQSMQSQYLQEINTFDEGSSSKSQMGVFDKDFQVQCMQDPKKFLSNYHQNLASNATMNQQCLICCGNLCVCFSPFFGCCGCTSCCCMYMLQTSKVGLVQVFGKFTRLLKPGINLINPCSQEVREVDLRLKGLGAGRHPTITKDQVKVDIQASLTYRITNPIISYYLLGNNFNRALTELTISSLRDTIGQYNLEQLLIERFLIANQARGLVVKGMPAGVEVQNVFIDEIAIPQQIQQGLTAAARQKRLSQATIINSKADVQSATLMQQSAQLLNTKAAMQIRYLQMVQKLGEKGVLLMMDIGADKKGHN